MSTLIAYEGSIEYYQDGDDIYRALPGCLPRHYCWARNWDQSTAARRLRGEFDGKGGVSSEEAVRIVASEEQGRGPAGRERRYRGKG